VARLHVKRISLVGMNYLDIIDELDLKAESNLLDANERASKNEA
jgi:hypothetical protein